MQIVECFLILSYVKALFFLNKLSKNVDFIMTLFIYDCLRNSLVIVRESLAKHCLVLIKKFSFIIIIAIIVVIVIIVIIIIELFNNFK